ncbi:nodulin / glutamate-ammonia ligase-like protein [Alloactinosynnema sp. L-07]|uniref:amidohydrolase family protein n=1 Tax=Alloactinosynnema sp. L-07 TaxID=1653480 RepID=UPI00065F03C6|nr:amidohydrolase family protein [Alloactinosynnema sp. L-07]CRK56574.1 nodulin / glutamate-ammonia ligase-like protein [Alloactinosynnema sp. L-07]
MITDGLPLVDHHCHGVIPRDLDHRRFTALLGEGRGHGGDPFDSMLGLAIRKWCAPVLGLAPHSTPAEYTEARISLGAEQVATRLLLATGVTDWLVDTGYPPDAVMPGQIGGGADHEIVRVEQVAETLAGQGDLTLDALRERLAERGKRAVAFKTVIAYRCGLAVPRTRPDDADARRAADRWQRSGQARLTDPVLLAWLLHETTVIGAELGLPVQVHTGFGDDDLRLDQANPVLLTDFLRSTKDNGVTVVLLHCWPFHREAGYLAHVFGHVRVDVGLAVPLVGARADTVYAELLELAPFPSVLYSSDGCGVPETHYLGAALFRHHVGRLIDSWIADDLITTADAERVVRAMATANARTTYPRLSLADQVA